MSLIEQFKPQFFFRNAHIQTMVNQITRAPTKLTDSTPWSVTNENITLHGKMHLQNVEAHHVIVIFHGLGGHIESPYITGVAGSLIQKGFSVLRMSLRGGNDDSSHTYHASQTEDIGWIVENLIQNGYTVSLLGFSLSATMILKWLEQRRPIENAFLVSPAINLDHCVTRLDQRSNRIYQKYFLKKLQKLLEKKAASNPDLFRRYLNNETFSSIRAFDTCFTAKQNGFPSAEDYYRNSSPSRLDHIKNNIAILHSKDDPFIDCEDLINAKASTGSNVQIHLTNFGGHVGFYQGWKYGYMIDKWAPQYFEETLPRKK